VSPLLHTGCCSEHALNQSKSHFIILTFIYYGAITEAQLLLYQSLDEPHIIIATSTLAWAIIFDPVRRYIQSQISRRFNLRDREKAIKAFTATLREEIDLEQLRERFLTIIQRTMQPYSVSQNEATQGTTWLVAPLLGGALYSLSQLLPFLADAISYVVSVCSLLQIRTPFQQACPPARRRIFTDIHEGLVWLWHQLLIRYMAFLTGGWNFASGGFIPILVVLAHDPRHLGRPPCLGCLDHDAVPLSCCPRSGECRGAPNALSRGSGGPGNRLLPPAGW